MVEPESGPRGILSDTGYTSSKTSVSGVSSRRGEHETQKEPTTAIHLEPNDHATDPDIPVRTVQQVNPFHHTEYESE